MTRDFVYSNKHMLTFRTCLLSTTTEGEKTVKNYRTEDLEVYKVV